MIHCEVFRMERPWRMLDIIPVFAQRKWGSSRKNCSQKSQPPGQNKNWISITSTRLQLCRPVNHFGISHISSVTRNKKLLFLPINVSIMFCLIAPDIYALTECRAIANNSHHKRGRFCTLPVCCSGTFRKGKIEINIILVLN